MDPFNLTVSRYPRVEKPNMIKERHKLSDVITPELTFEELITLIGELGHSFSHAVCDGDISINCENFQSSQLLVLDIDNKEQVFHPAQALEHLHTLGLDCNAIYVTFSIPTGASVGHPSLVKTHKPPKTHLGLH